MAFSPGPPPATGAATPLAVTGAFDEGGCVKESGSAARSGPVLEAAV